MIENLPEINLDRIAYFDNAVFYCMDESSKRVPVGIISRVTTIQKNILEFSLTHFPVLEQSWNVFAGELHFYKKGLSFNMHLHGTGWFVSKDDLKVQFKVLHIENFGEPEVKPYSFQESVIDFFSNTSMFFKKMLVTGF